jgi:hypothetical protein
MDNKNVVRNILLFLIVRAQIFSETEAAKCSVKVVQCDEC